MGLHFEVGSKGGPFAVSLAPHLELGKKLVMSSKLFNCQLLPLLDRFSK